jgi:molybdate transport system substrate-binding protein
VPSATPFANNRLVVVARDAEVEIESPEALRDEGIRRIAIPSPAVPVGRYAREWLARNDLLDVLDARAVQTEHARATLMAVDHGHADVAIVYETDARLARNAVVAYRIADADQSVIEYVALLCPEAAASPLAERWLHFMAEPEAREALEAAGFGTPSLRGLP